MISIIQSVQMDFTRRLSTHMWERNCGTKSVGALEAKVPPVLFGCVKSLVNFACRLILFLSAVISRDDAVWNPQALIACPSWAHAFMRCRIRCNFGLLGKAANYELGGDRDVVKVCRHFWSTLEYWLPACQTLPSTFDFRFNSPIKLAHHDEKRFLGLMCQQKSMQMPGVNGARESVVHRRDDKSYQHWMLNAALFGLWTNPTERFCIKRLPNIRANIILPVCQLRLHTKQAIFHWE